MIWVLAKNKKQDQASILYQIVDHTWITRHIQNTLDSCKAPTIPEIIPMSFLFSFFRLFTNRIGIITTDSSTQTRYATTANGLRRIVRGEFGMVTGVR